MCRPAPVKAATRYFPHGSNSPAKIGGGQVQPTQRGQADIALRVTRREPDAESAGAAPAEPGDMFRQVRLLAGSGTDLAEESLNVTGQADAPL